MLSPISVWTLTSDWIRTYDDAVEPSICAEWREMIDSSALTKRINEEYLSCRKLALDHMVWSHLHDRIAEAFNRYKQDVPHNGNLHFCTHVEVVSVLKYEPNGTDHFHLHADNWNGESSLRQVSAIMFLNSVASGGNVIFPTLGMTVRPVEGRVLLFPAFFPFLHRAESPLSEAKYTAVTWLCYPPPATYYRVSPL